MNLLSLSVGLASNHTSIYKIFALLEIQKLQSLNRFIKVLICMSKITSATSPSGPRKTGEKEEDRGKGRKGGMGSRFIGSRTAKFVRERTFLDESRRWYFLHLIQPCGCNTQ